MAHVFNKMPYLVMVHLESVFNVVSLLYSVACRSAVSVRTLALPGPVCASAAMQECVAPTSMSPVHRGRDSCLKLQQRRLGKKLFKP